MKNTLALVTLALSLFIGVAASTNVSVALPAIDRELDVGPSGQQWLVEAYVLVFASLLMAGGALGDRVGRKGLFLVGAVTFGIGSLVAGLAPSLPVLLIGRAIQGIGPALLTTGSLAIIRAMYVDPARRATAIGVWSTASGLALALGPLLGGVLTSSLGWRWVLLYNAPVALALMVLAALTVPRLPVGGAGTRFDALGAVLTVLMVGTLAYGLTEAPTLGWTALPVIALGITFAMSTALFVWWELRNPDPLTDLRLFRNPTFAAVNVAALIVFLAFIGSVVYFSDYFQRVQELSPVATGLALCSIGVPVAAGSLIAGRLVGRIGTLALILTGLGLAGTGMLLLVGLQADTPTSDSWWRFAIAGFGVGLSSTPMTNSAVSAVEAERAGMASAIHTAMRQVGQVLGVAVLGAIVFASAPSTGPLTDVDRENLMSGLHAAVVVAGSALLAAGVCVAVLYAVDRRTKTTHDTRVGLVQPPTPADNHFLGA